MNAPTNVCLLRLIIRMHVSDFISIVNAIFMPQFLICVGKIEVPISLIQMLAKLLSFRNRRFYRIQTDKDNLNFSPVL